MRHYSQGVALRGEGLALRQQSSWTLTSGWSIRRTPPCWRPGVTSILAAQGIGKQRPRRSGRKSRMNPLANPVLGPAAPLREPAKVASPRGEPTVY